MGDPKRPRAKYSGPSHPWQLERIEEEKILLKEYGLKNKSEIFKTQSRLKGFASLAKKLIAARGTQAEKERTQLVSRLARMGLIKADAQLDDILSLQIRNLLERRLQTFMVRKGLARTMRQARQYISHEHVLIGGKIISAPSYHVLLDEDLKFVGTSTLASVTHPERALPPRPPEPPRPKEEPRRGGRRPVRRQQRRPGAGGRMPRKPAAAGKPASGKPAAGGKK